LEEAKKIALLGFAGIDKGNNTVLLLKVIDQQVSNLLVEEFNIPDLALKQ
jgi:hypothetical protein